jgi:hypothetical protein
MCWVAGAFLKQWQTKSGTQKVADRSARLASASSTLYTIALNEGKQLSQRHLRQYQPMACHSGASAHTSADKPPFDSIKSLQIANNGRGIRLGSQGREPAGALA